MEQLQRRLGLDSSNSGKPPSSDGPGKPPAKPRTAPAGPVGKRPGGQPGHKGVTLSQTATPDQIETHVPTSCADCGASLSAPDTEGEPLRRQVFDLAPPPPLEVTEHQAAAAAPVLTHSTARGSNGGQNAAQRLVELFQTCLAWRSARRPWRG